MHKRLIGYLFLGVFLYVGNVSAATVYVHDYLRLGVRTHPNSSEPAIAVVTTGDALQVLERREGYLKIRAEDGSEGWVSESYVSEEKPARLQLEQLQQAFKSREEKLNILRQSLAESEGKSAALEKRLAALKSENEALDRQVNELTGRSAELYRKYIWVFRGVVVLIMLLLGFYFGVRWYKRRITDRLGGLEI